QVLVAARFEVTALGLVETFVLTVTELNRFVTVLLFRPNLRHDVRAALDHRDRVHQPRVIEDLRHPQLSSNHPFDHWLSPASSGRGLSQWPVPPSELDERAVGRRQTAVHRFVLPSASCMLPSTT